MTATEQTLAQIVEGMDALVDAQVAQWTIPGMAVGVLLNGERSTYATGVAKLTTGEAMLPNTLTRVASISKVFTATLAMTLVDAGLLDLDRPVVEYLPDLQLMDQGVLQTLTTRQLLSHGSGLHGDFSIDCGQGTDALERAIREFRTLPQVVAPGEVWAYTNSGFHLAGRVIEVVAGKPFDEAMRERVFKPFGLERSGFFAHEMIVWPHALGHDQVAPEADEHVPATTYYPRNRFPAGGVVSNVPDLLTFAEVHLNGGTAADGTGTQALSGTSVEAMQETQRTAGCWADAWGIGWDIRWYGDVKVISHGGTINGFKSHLTLVPSCNFACVQLTNSGRGDTANGAVENWLLESQLGLSRNLPSPVTLPVETLEAMAGTYSHPAGTITLEAVGPGELHLLRTGTWPGIDGPVDFPPQRILTTSATTFVASGGEADGDRIDLVLHADGRPRFLRVGGRLFARDTD